MQSLGQKNSFTPDKKNISVQSENVLQSEEQDNFSLDDKTFSPNNTNNYLTNFSDTDFNQSIYKEGSGLIDKSNNNIISQKISYEDILKHYELEYVDPRDIRGKFHLQLANLIYDELSKPGENVFLSKTNIVSKVDFKNRAMQLSTMHFDYVQDALKDQKQKITNIKSYLLTALYNSFSSLDSYYLNQVKGENNYFNL